MAAGKTKIGKSLADRLRKPFFDLDSYIEDQTGRDIPEIFYKNGEDYFRSLERKYLQKLLGVTSGIISLGGGALHNKDVVKTVKSKSLMVFINTPFSTILHRLYEDGTRPLLKDKNGKLKSRSRLKNDLKELYVKRLPLYKKANVKFSPDISKSAADNAKELTRILENL